jgi:hypothetical protein
MTAFRIAHRPAPARALRAAAAAAVALLAAGCSNSEPQPVPLGANTLTVVVLVVDSLMPHEITAATPNLLALTSGGTIATPDGPLVVAGGTSYAESRAVYAAETIPNHVAMMTGVYPARNNIPTNDFIDEFSGTSTVEARLSIPERLTASTLFTWIHQRCRATGVNPGIRTGATLSKKYLYDIFLGDAASFRLNDDPDVFNVQPDTYWDPESSDAYIGSPDEHTPDLPTMTDARARIADADFFFINLGDVDRLAHASGEQARNLALTDADGLVGQLIGDLQAAGRWANTVLFLVSDHGMDYSAPGPATAISTQTTLDALGACFTPMRAVASGGTESIYVLDRALPLEQRRSALRAARSCLLDGTTCGNLCLGATAPTNAGLIAGAWYTADDPLDPAGAMPLFIASGSPNLGDLTVFAADTGKFGEPSVSDANAQIPGNHGHPLTLHNTLVVTGGSPWVKQGQLIAASVPGATVFDRLPEQSENVDIAPTVAWLLGLAIEPAAFPDYPEHDAGFDGRVLKEAFTQFDGDPGAGSPTVCGRFD